MPFGSDEAISRPAFISSVYRCWVIVSSAAIYRFFSLGSWPTQRVWLLAGGMPGLTVRKVLLLNGLGLLVTSKEVLQRPCESFSERLTPESKATFNRVCAKFGTEDSAVVSGADQDKIEACKLDVDDGGDGSW